MKICKKCGVCKPLDNFTARTGTRDGLRSECKDCRSIQGKTRRVRIALENKPMRCM
jgi:hypothetical protein